MQPKQPTVAGPMPRRRWQFSLRSLLVVVTVLCVMLGTVGVRLVIPGQKQQRAVEAILERGGRVLYADDEPDEPWHTRLARDWLPRDYVSRVYLVDLRMASLVTDNDLILLQDLPALQRLNLADTQVTDGGLLHLARLSQLRSLNVENTAVSAARLRQLSLPHLEDVWLYGTTVSASELQRSWTECRMNRFPQGTEFQSPDIE